MFKSIKYILYDYDTDCDIYKLIDTDFECEVSMKTSSERIITQCASSELPVNESVSLVTGIVIMAVASVKEYKKRNYSHKEIIKNLFKYNLYINNEYKYCFERILNLEIIYTDRFFKSIYFSKLYYEDLKNMWDKHKAFI